MFFILRSAFWLGLALLVIQPHGFDLTGSAQSLGTAAVESGRSAALNGLDHVTCETFECAGAKLVAQTALKPAPAPRDVVINAPFPAAPLNRTHS